jgi:hypothetical protein
MGTPPSSPGFGAAVVPPSELPPSPPTMTSTGSPMSQSPPQPLRRPPPPPHTSSLHSFAQTASRSSGDLSMYYAASSPSGRKPQPSPLTQSPGTPDVCGPSSSFSFSLKKTTTPPLPFLETSSHALALSLSADTTPAPCWTTTITHVPTAAAPEISIRERTHIHKKKGALARPHINTTTFSQYGTTRPLPGMVGTTGSMNPLVASPGLPPPSIA